MEIIENQSAEGAASADQPDEMYLMPELEAAGELVESFFDQLAVRGIGGRPTVGGVSAGGGPSPMLRARVTATRQREVELLRVKQGMKSDSEVVRAALDEYVERHLEGH